MSAEHTMQGVTTTTEGTSTCDHSVEKGKGKAPEKIEQTQGQDSSSDEEDVGSELADEDEDYKEIDPSNILPPGRRTRGKIIDFTAVADKDAMEDDDEDDEEYKGAVDPEDSDAKMEL